VRCKKKTKEREEISDCGFRIADLKKQKKGCGGTETRGDGETEDEKLLGTRHFKTTRRRGETETRRRRQKSEGGRQQAGGRLQRAEDSRQKITRH